MRLNLAGGVIAALIIVALIVSLVLLGVGSG